MKDYQPLAFNIRVYGIYLDNRCLLVNEEQVHGKNIIKLPGGGLELGEGPITGLMREWKEELGLDIEVVKHYYTTDFFQQSAYNDTQVVAIYYLINANVPTELKNRIASERSFWLPLTDLTEKTFTLPIDQVVGNRIRRDFI